VRHFYQRYLTEFIDSDLERGNGFFINNQILDDCLIKRSTKVIESIQEEIYKEVREGICKYFDIGNLTELNEDQINQVINDQ
jgi:hypothetical protein